MLFILIGLAVLFLDQLTKQAVRSNFVYGESRPIIDGFFNLVYVRNDGAAWNILSGHGLVLILISLSVLILLIVYRRSFLGDSFFHRVLLGLMIGGIAGNLIDRIRFGWVTDFLDFEFGSYHYPSFNIADSAICIAVVLYVISNLVQEKKRKTDFEGSENG
ncbi:MAG TPA: signal peptidase II [Pontiella sp.]